VARLQGLLKRPSKAEELELELARQGSVARLERLMAQRAGTFVEDDEMPAEGDGSAEPIEVEESTKTSAEMTDPSEAPAEATPASADPSEVPAEATAALAEPAEAGVSAAAPQDTEVPTTTTAGVPVMAPDAVDVTRQRAVRRRPSAMVVADDWDGPGATGADGEAGVRVDGEANPAVAAPREADEPTPTEAPVVDEPVAAPVSQSTMARTPRTASAKTSTRAKAATGAKAATPTKAASSRPTTSSKRSADPPPPPRTRAASNGAVLPKRAARQPRQPAVLAACPSCAVLLDPRPTASRRCGQCRERIVVKRLEGGVLYLTRPAAAALEAGQRRVKETARLARLRDRWLAQASAVGASPAAIERIGRVTASEEGVQAARGLYLGAANRAFTAAHRERRFAEAASIRRAQALALVREKGAAVPVSDEVIALYRDAMSAELKAQREFGRDAELAAASCCEVCRLDDGLVVRISEEVKATRLPHAGCPKGVCQCRWLAARVAGRRAAVNVGSGR
jgi:hypothetical protein